MNKHLILCVLTAIAAFPQAQTPLTITQSAGSATGEIRMQERRTNGQNYVGLKAPQSISANTVWTLPDADGTSGQCLDTNGSGILAWHTCSGERMVSDYNWSQVVGAVTAGNVITLTFTGTACPAAATDTNYRLRLYETATPTSYELREITGGTCTRGGSGTLVTGAATVSYTNATATSASGGLQEAIFSVADGNSVYARAGLGTYEIYSDVLDESRYLNLICDGAGAFFVAKADNLKMIHSTSSGGPQIRGCSFLNTYSHASVTAIYTNNPSGSVTGTSVVRNTISGMDVCVHLATVNAVREFSYNQISDCTTAAVRIEASGTGGDAGVGLIGPGNTFLGNATIYGVEWRGPGNLKLHGNSFNGFVEQFHGELKMGVVNVSGTTVTRVSGTPFTASMIGYAFVANDATNSVASTISAWTSSSVMTLTSNSVTCTGCSYYVGVSGQLQIIGNTFDGGSNTTHSVRLSGHIPFFNFHIDDNFMTAYTVSNFKGITVEGRGWYHGHVVSNKIPTSTTGTTIGVDVSGGTAIDVNGNQCVNNLTCVNIGSSANQVTTHHNQCATVYTNNCVLSTSSTSIVHEIAPVTFAQLAALTVANSSTLYCSDCKRTSLASTTCASGGSGAKATRINGAWSCDDATVGGPWTASGSDIYFSGTGNVGIHGAPAADLSITGGGAGANALLIQDGGANTTLQLIADNGFAFLSTYTAHPFIFGTDSTGRWRLNAAGMWHPESNDAYDIGLSSQRVRGIYARFGSFVAPGGTSSSDYVSMRKANICDSSGGGGCWDIQAGGSMASTSEFQIRDNAGSRWLEGWRAILGSPLNYTSVFSDWIPAKRATGSGDAVSDSTFPQLGSAGSPWSKAYASEIYGDLKSSTTNTKKIQPDANLTWDLGDPSAQYNALWVGSITATSNVTFSARSIFSADQTIDFGTSSNRMGRLYAKGWTTYGSSFAAAGASITIQSGATFTDGRTCSAGDVWTADVSGNLACAAPAGGGAWSTSGSDAYRSTGAVWIGKSTNNISAKLEVENSASVNLLQLKYTGTVSSISGGGISAHQGSLPTAADQRLGFMVFGVESGGTQYNRAAIMAFSSQTWSAGSAEGEYLQFLTTSSGSTTRTARWRVADSGDWLPEAATTYSVGSSGARTLKVWTSALDASGAVTLSGSTITASSTFSSDLIPTSASTYALGSSSFRWLGYLSTLNVSSTFTLNGSITGDLKFTAANTYVLGDSTNYLNAAHVNTYQVYGQVKPFSGVTTADLGASTSRFRKLWISDINANGTITAPDGNTGVSATKTVGNGAGGTCTLIFSGGILTGGTC